MSEIIERKAFEIGNYEPENGSYMVVNKKIINEIVRGKEVRLEEVVFRKPYAGIKIEGDKIEITDKNPIPESRPTLRAMFERGDIVLLKRDFRERINIAPGMRVKMFLRFRGGKK